MNWWDKIISDKDGLPGKPTIKGTRLSVEFVIERLVRGRTQEQLLRNINDDRFGWENSFCRPNRFS